MAGLTQDIMDNVIKPFWKSYDQYFVECKSAVSFFELVNIVHNATHRWLAYLYENKKYWAEEFSPFWQKTIMPLQMLHNDILGRMLYVAKKGLDIVPDAGDFSQNPVMKFLCDSLKSRRQRYNMAMHFIEFLFSLCWLEGIALTGDPGLVYGGILRAAFAGQEFLPFFVKWPGIQEKLPLVERYRERAEQQHLEFQDYGFVVDVGLLFAVAISRDLCDGSPVGGSEACTQRGKSTDNFGHFMQFASGEEEHPIKSATDLPTPVRLKQILKRLSDARIFQRVDGEFAYAKGSYWVILPNAVAVFLILPYSSGFYFPPATPIADKPKIFGYDPLRRSMALMKECGGPFYTEGLQELHNVLKGCRGLTRVETLGRQKLLDGLVGSLRKCRTQQVAGFLLGYYVILLALRCDGYLGVELPESLKDILPPIIGLYFPDIVSRIIEREHRDALKDEIDAILKAIRPDCV